MPIHKYKLLRGIHIQGGIGDEKKIYVPKIVKERLGDKAIEQFQNVNGVLQDTDIVETDIDLVKEFGPKFKNISVNSDYEAVQEGTTIESILSMNKEQLKAYAIGDLGINVQAEDTKKEILGMVFEHFAST